MRWRNMRRGLKPFDARGRPYWLPFPSTLTGHHPSNCAGRRWHKNKPQSVYMRKARWICGKLEYCAFCWQRDKLMWAARGVRDHLGLKSVHFSARPFAAGTDPVLIGEARDKLWMWLKKQGFTAIYLGVHVYGEGMQKVDPHFDVLASGPAPNAAWRDRPGVPLPPLEPYQRDFLAKHGGKAFHATKLRDGWTVAARRQRAHAAGYAMRCTFDVPRLVVGRWGTDFFGGSEIYDLRKKTGGKRLGRLTDQRRMAAAEEHWRMWALARRRHTNRSKSPSDAQRRKRAEIMAAQHVERYWWAWRLDDFSPDAAYRAKRRAAKSAQVRASQAAKALT